MLHEGEKQIGEVSCGNIDISLPVCQRNTNYKRWNVNHKVAAIVHEDHNSGLADCLADLKFV